jgi:hypothetical protein
MGKKPTEPPLDLEDVLTTIANVAGWQQQLALEALRQMREAGHGDPKGPVDDPIDPTPQSPDP